MAHNYKQHQSKSHLPVGKHPDRPSHPALSAGRVGYAEEPSDRRAGGFSAFRWRWILPPVVSAVTATFAVTLLSALAVGNGDPNALIGILAPVATGIASLAGGITAGLCHRRRSVMTALLYGGAPAVILCLIGLSAGQGTPVAWLTRLLPLPLYVLGGFITRPGTPKARHGR